VDGAVARADVVPGGESRPKRGKLGRSWSARGGSRPRTQRWASGDRSPWFSAPLHRF